MTTYRHIYHLPSPDPSTSFVAHPTCKSRVPFWRDDRANSSVSKFPSRECLDTVGLGRCGSEVESAAATAGNPRTALLRAATKECFRRQVQGVLGHTERSLEGRVAGDATTLCPSMGPISQGPMGRAGGGGHPIRKVEIWRL